MTDEKEDLEREAFEEWYCRSISESIGLERYPNGCFCNPEAENMYLAWCVAKSHAEKSAWISVEDRLPEVGKIVAVCYFKHNEIVCDKGEIMDDTWDNAWVVRDDRRYSLTDVTHWQPLPEPPKAA